MFHRSVSTTESLVPACGEIEPPAPFAARCELGYVRAEAMGGYFSSLFSELGARRRRLRDSLGDRGQALAEFLVMGGLLVGSLGLFARAWMPAAAPWGFWLPGVFLVGYLLIEARRQSALAHGADAGKTSAGYDWIALLWSFGCALAGAAAFVIAWGAAPPPAPQEEIWAPPDSAVAVDIEPD